MSNETRKPPFGLDMPFGEALERFIGTDRAEVLEAERGGPVRKTKKRSNMAKRVVRYGRTTTHNRRYCPLPKIDEKQPYKSRFPNMVSQSFFCQRDLDKWPLWEGAGRTGHYPVRCFRKWHPNWNSGHANYTRTFARE